MKPTTTRLHVPDQKCHWCPDILHTNPITIDTTTDNRTRQQLTQQAQHTTHNQHMNTYHPNVTAVLYEGRP